MVICPGCGHDNRSTRQFCRQCGQGLGEPWPPSAAVNGPGDQFCGSCGTEIAEAPRSDGGGRRSSRAYRAEGDAAPQVSASLSTIALEDEQPTRLQPEAPPEKAQPEESRSTELDPRRDTQRKFLNELLSDLEELGPDEPT